ncbi:MAG: TFIIB-type zinc finger domain-containing protein [Pseudomonadota bacterium]
MDTAPPPLDEALPAPSFVEEHRFPCTNCGSEFRFDPASGGLQCDHCGNGEPIEAGDARDAGRELDFHSAQRGDLSADMIEETRTASCPNCGAKVEFDPSQHAAECPFCATPVVTDTGTNRHIKPRGVLPFAVAESAGRDAVGKWLGSLWFAPNGVSEYAKKGRKLSGIYVPYWTYDTVTRTAYSGQRGVHYYETRTVMRDGKQETEQVRKTRWSNTRGRVARAFDDVLILASKALPKRYTDRLGPWDLDALQAYEPRYLAGFRAEAYTIGLDDGFENAKQVMSWQIEQDIRRDIGGDEQRITSRDTDYSDITFKHLLLPVWMAAYKYRGKSYRFVINGRTGAVQGERPYSAWKIAFAVIIAIIVLGVGAFIASEM